MSNESTTPAVKPMKQANSNMLKQKRFLDSQSKSTKDTKSSPLATTLRYLLVTLMSLVLVSKITTSSLFFNYPIPFSLPTLNELQARFLPTALPASPAVPTLLLTPAQLALYDGRHPPKGIYLAIDGEVYDVTTGDAYQPGGSYGLFAGKDAARAFITGCFKPKGLTHDLRGLTEEELESLAYWKTFYRNHEQYKRVGTVIHPSIDPASPLPVCE